MIGATSCHHTVADVVVLQHRKRGTDCGDHGRSATTRPAKHVGGLKPHTCPAPASIVATHVTRDSTCSALAGGAIGSGNAEQRTELDCCGRHGQHAELAASDGKRWPSVVLSAARSIATV